MPEAGKELPTGCSSILPLGLKLGVGAGRAAVRAKVKTRKIPRKGRLAPDTCVICHCIGNKKRQEFPRLMWERDLPKVTWL